MSPPRLFVNKSGRKREGANTADSHPCGRRQTLGMATLQLRGAALCSGCKRASECVREYLLSLNDGDGRIRQRAFCASGSSTRDDVILEASPASSNSDSQYLPKPRALLTDSWRFLLGQWFALPDCWVLLIHKLDRKRTSPRLAIRFRWGPSVTPSELHHHSTI